MENNDNVKGRIRSASTPPSAFFSGGTEIVDALGEVFVGEGIDALQLDESRSASRQRWPYTDFQLGERGSRNLLPGHRCSVVSRCAPGSHSRSVEACGIEVVVLRSARPRRADSASGPSRRARLLRTVASVPPTRERYVSSRLVELAIAPAYSRWTARLRRSSNGNGSLPVWRRSRSKPRGTSVAWAFPGQVDVTGTSRE